MRKFPAKQLVICMLSGLVAVGCATNKPPAPTGPSPATTQAIDEAQAIVNGAQAPCADTGNAASLLSQAQQAAQAGHDAQAQDLANQAKKAAHQSTNNCYMNRARNLLAQAQKYTNLNSDQEGRLSSAQQALQNGQGRRAYEGLQSLLAELKAAHTVYTVAPGDSLWMISAKSDVYGNPYEWPMIYKANSGKINDPDLIFPDQDLTIHMNPIQDAVNAAIYHSKNRGQWSIGHTEQSDRDYLSGQSGQ